ncbi:DoxX family protein [Marinilabiliaceae bacterium ANBcel2]|nr:DoxX family protein [Marinilabiliaceae bacterium ANBcel2]
MKQLIKNEKDFAALILRVGFGFYLAFGHGLAKLQMVINGNFQFPELFGLPASINLTLAMLAEFFASLLVLIGFKTRLAALPVVITMATALFMVHLNDPMFGGDGTKEPAMMYLLGFVAIFLLGPGKYSIDSAIKKK